MEESNSILQTESSTDGEIMTTGSPSQNFFYGYIYNKNKDPIRSFLINLTNNEPTETDASGFYRILGKGGDIIKISSNGYRSKTLVLNEDGTTNNTILEPIILYIYILPLFFFFIFFIIIIIITSFGLKSFSYIKNSNIKEVRDIWISWIVFCVISFFSIFISYILPVGVIITSIIYLIYIVLSVYIIRFLDIIKNTQ